jgi:hypothetical protein
VHARKVERGEVLAVLGPKLLGNGMASRVTSCQVRGKTHLLSRQLYMQLSTPLRH